MKKNIITLFMILTGHYCSAQNLSEDIQNEIRLCKSGNSGSCLTVGEYYSRYKNSKSDGYFRTACYYGSASGCYKKGIYLMKSTDIKVSENADFAFASACAYGHLKSCRKIGISYHTKSEGMPNDLDKKINFYQHSCQLGNNEGCRFKEKFVKCKSYGIIGC